MSKILEMLNGKKTVIGSALGGMVLVAAGLGYLTEAQSAVLLGFVAFFTGVAMRQAVQKSAVSVSAVTDLLSDPKVLATIAEAVSQLKKPEAPKP